MESLLVIGHLTRDRVRLSRSLSYMEAPGGSSFYTSLVTSSLGVDTKVLSKVGEDYPSHYLEMLRDRLIDTSLIRKTCLPTTTFELTYDDRGGRSLRVLSICEEIRLEDCRDIDEDWAVHIGSVVDEVAHEAYGLLSRRARFVSMDAQGIVRFIDRYGIVRLKTPNDASFLEGVGLLKATDDELMHLFDAGSLVEAAKSFFKIAGRESLLTVTLGKLGCLLLTRREIYRAPAYPVGKVGDPTGAGDALVGGVVSSILRGEDLDYALAVGAASASFCVEKASVHGFSIDSSLGERVQWLYSRIRREPRHPVS